MIDSSPDNLMIFTGNANRPLAQAVCRLIACREAYAGFTLSDVEVGQFSDGEVKIDGFPDVRRKDTYIIQPTSSPSERNLMELCLMVNALKEASADQVTVVMTYFGYGRQDRKDKARVPISARVVADMIMSTGVDRVVFLDMHSAQVVGFFGVQVKKDHLFARPEITKDLINRFGQVMEQVIIASPDAGGMARAQAYASRLGTDLVSIYKRRIAANRAKALKIIGDVNGKIVIFIDDIIDTFGSMDEAVNLVLEQGAIEAHACVTHGVLSGPALDRINASRIKSVIVTDSIDLQEKIQFSAKIQVVSIANLIARAICRLHEGRSVSELFD